MTQQAPPIRHVQNVRDLLVVALTPELAKLMIEHQTRFDFPNPINDEQRLTMLQEIVAFVIDSITPRSMELLAELHAKQTPGEASKQH